MTSLPPDANAATANEISRTEMLPFLLPFSDLRRRAYLWPGVILAVFVVVLLALAGLKEEAGFFWALAAFISLGTLYLVHLACGQKQPFFYVLLVAALAFGLDALLLTAIDRAESVLPLFAAPGLIEETVKALPLGLVLLATWKLPHARQRKYGLREPLDGILLAAASATGFAFLETMFVYVPHFGALIGAPRMLTNGFGHIAYAGAFGYFVGLAALHGHNRKRVVLALVIGFVIANALHDLWDAMRFYGGPLSIMSPLHEVAVAVLAFVVLASMILKGREVSPEREFLWPYGSMEPYRAPEVDPLPAMPAPVGDLWLQIGAIRTRLAEEAVVTIADIPSLKGRAPDGTVGEVRRHPTEPGLFVLRNLSSATWEAVLPDGSVRDVEPAQTIRLVAGTRLDFGTQHGAILVTAHDPESDPPPKSEDEWC
ncbi:MAG TPA: PrsW family glutamic-type intramembrane protease [Stellaceae bacterium]|jgi:RsiW-degrading membrane proteinase PrsW (M82 family)